MRMLPNRFHLPGQARYDRLCRCFLALSLAVCLAGSRNHALAAEAYLWLDKDVPGAAAQQALGVLAGAAAEGLDTKDYAVDQLRALLQSAVKGAPMSEERLAHLDQELTATMLRYLKDLRRGRIEPRQLSAGYRRVADDFDAEAALRAAVAENRVTEMAREMAPATPEYASLRAALALYRGLIDKAVWQRSLASPLGGKLLPGQAYIDLPRLTQRLVDLGDLPTHTSPPKRYEGPLLAGVKSFQERHALTADGVIGAGTLAQLNVSPEARARQIELALEQLRWTPTAKNRRHIVVNIPEFILRAYAPRAGQSEEVVAMKVIVGRADKTRTPLFDTEMRVIEFSPNWNVPPSIAKGETLPRLRRDPAYFQRQGLEFVDSEGRAVVDFSEASLDAVERGKMRIRQRPSAGNALGQIKFVLPNSDAIYLHHTPSPHLFRRDRRDFSHGCVRVEAPVELAEYVLANEPEWSRERIVKAMGRGKPTIASVREPLPVIIAYRTAVARHDRLYFFPDIYGLEKMLETALRQRSSVVRASSAGKIAAKSAS